MSDWEKNDKEETVSLLTSNENGKRDAKAVLSFHFFFEYSLKPLTIVIGYPNSARYDTIAEKVFSIKPNITLHILH